MTTAISRERAWWVSLKHGGLLIAPSKLAEFFPEDIDPLPKYVIERLRRDVTRLQSGEDKYLPTLFDTLVEHVLGYPKNQWTKGSVVDTKWSRRAITGEIVKPRYLWQDASGEILPVFVADAALGAGHDHETVSRLGIGRGRRSVSRVIEWLRHTGEKIALLTNARQWRLIHAGADYDAWCEWDIDLWFEEGAPGSQVTALRQLLGVDALKKRSADEPSRLLAAIQASRKGQAELSSALGERVRQAVEHLVHASSEALNVFEGNAPTPETRRAIYIAATRLIMRCVVVLFAEARELLPRNNPIYNDSYGLQGLREQLDRLAGGRGPERLRHSWGAWPRIISLFRLIFSGSGHEALPIQRYGGGLFTPGDPNADDSTSRALAALENQKDCPSDADAHRILELLCHSKVKVRQGRGSTWVPVPVDFSDLSSEYIGILYEGLLDFELRRAETDAPIVFLNIGDQPALPFSRLEAMDDSGLSSLLSKLKVSTKKMASEEESEEGGDEGEDEGEEEEIEAESADDDEPVEELDVDQAIRDAVFGWAERAVKAAKIVKAPKGKKEGRAKAEYEEHVGKAARGLVGRIIPPGDWYLVRWGGTRKGAGTFYTRPQLAVPTTRRTLQPLAFDVGSDGQAVPKKPEDILALKVCDPAMGSGSFLVAALRFITDALLVSLHHHGRLEETVGRTICRLADGVPLDHPSQESLPVPKDHPEFEDRLRARLKRHVVERCIYGVDLDPLAVELARMALWIETMDQRLPFSFLDHKIKCGNSLVGCWFDRFQEYPAMAWERQGDEWTDAIKQFKNTKVKPALAAWIKARREDVLPFMKKGFTLDDLHRDAVRVFEELHALPVQETERRETIYREHILANEEFSRLKSAFDTWSAVWFWPGDQLNLAPMPRDFVAPSKSTMDMVRSLTAHHRFFHWELEFPDVFSGPKSGFHALIGNPPWEIQKPNSKEFFSNIDPLYRAYGKQEALAKQREFFASNSDLARNWLIYSAQLKALSNWTKHSAFPFGDVKEGGDKLSFSRSTTDNVSLHDSWRKQRQGRKGYSDPEHPYRHQGSADINTYKMFLEIAHALAASGGQFGFLVPSGVYTDKGSTSLRQLFLTKCEWLWLFGFENREGIFDIHRSFKFCPVIVKKGGSTKAIRATFMHRSLEDWEDAERHVLAYPRERVEQFSPKSKAILEIRTERDLEILEKLYAKGVLLGDDSPDGWGIKYATEFHMTNDSKLFPPTPKWEEQGYRPDEYGHWLMGKWKPYDGPRSILNRKKGLVLSCDGTQTIYVDEIEDVALPLYQGVMIGQFDFAAARYLSGAGNRAHWEPLSWEEKRLAPQFLMAAETIFEKNGGGLRGCKLGFRDISNATNERTFITSVVPDVPCGNTLGILRTDRERPLGLAVALTSLACDWATRLRMGGMHLNLFVIEDVPVLRPGWSDQHRRLPVLGASLAFGHLIFAHEWLTLSMAERCHPWKALWAVTLHERLRFRSIVDAVVADLYGLTSWDLAWNIRDCDNPAAVMHSDDFTRALDPKGFWRVDKECDPELRHPVLAYVAFCDLKEKGLDAFLSQNDGEGWMIPEKLRLADYGLGHDDRAKEYQPVASRLGDRFLPWQLEQSVEESWEECERHAELIERIVPRPKPSQTAVPTAGSRSDAPKDLFGNPEPTDLFGKVVEPTRKSRRK